VGCQQKETGALKFLDAQKTKKIFLLLIPLETQMDPGMSIKVKSTCGQPRWPKDLA
jgi:hypothetical protein